MVQDPTQPKKEIRLPEQLARFEEELAAGIETFAQSVEFLQRYEGAVKHLTALCEEAIAIGDYSSTQVIDSPKTTDALPFYLINFEWNESVKNFLILWRNILFESQKAQVLLGEQKVETAAVEKLHEASVAQLRNAAEELKDYLGPGLGRYQKSKKGPATQVEQWARQNNPQPAYRQQFKTISEQATDLFSQYHESMVHVEHLMQIRERIQENTRLHKEEFANIEKAINDIRNFIATQEPEQAGKISVYLEDLEQHLTDFNNNLFTEAIEDDLTRLATQIKMVVMATPGPLQTMEIALRKQVDQWLNAEVIPLLAEAAELVENANNGFKMALVNVRNRAILYANDLKEQKETQINYEELCYPLDNFGNQLQAVEEQVIKLHRLARVRLSTELGLFAIFRKDKDFLTIPLQSTLNQYRINENPFFQQLRQWWQRQRNSLRKLQANVQQEEKLSLSEKVVRYIQRRTIDVNSKAIRADTR
ncbi:MAG: hypothetical protein AAFO94_00855 [Bacteroidota bacterium]